MSTTTQPQTSVTVVLVDTDESHNSRPKTMPRATAESFATIHAGMRVSGPKGVFVVDHAVMAEPDGQPFAFHP